MSLQIQSSSPFNNLSQKLINYFPTDVLHVIFNQYVLNPLDLVHVSLVCKKWHSVLHHDGFTEKIQSLMKSLGLILFQSVKKSGWDLLKEAYHAKCEAYFDISKSMRLSDNTQKVVFTKKFFSKVDETFEKVFHVINHLTMYTFSSTVHAGTPLKNRISFKKQFSGISKVKVSGTKLSFLQTILETYVNKHPSEQPEQQIIFIFSDLDLENDEQLFEQMKKVNALFLNYKNLSLIFIEISIRDHPHFFKTKLKKMIHEGSISYVHLIEDRSEPEVRVNKKRKLENV